MKEFNLKTHLALTDYEVSDKVEVQNLFCTSVTYLWHSSDRTLVCPHWEKHVSVVMLGIATHAPADVELSLDDNGQYTTYTW